MEQEACDGFQDTLASWLGFEEVGMGVMKYVLRSVWMAVEDIYVDEY